MGSMIEIARNSVQPWDIDQMGHMNIQFYTERCMDGLATLSIRLGLGRAYVHKHGQQLYAENLHVRFLSERRLGSPFYLRGGVVDMTGDGLSTYLEMADTATDRVVATFALDLVLRDTSTHAAVRIPKMAQEMARELLVKVPEYGQPRGLAMAAPRSPMSLDEANAMGLVPTFQAVIQPYCCDNNGWLTLRHFMGVVSNAVPNLMACVDGADASIRGSGRAALEYRFVYRRYPRMADVLALRSGLKEVGRKTYTWCHWLFDLETGEAVGSAEAIAVFIDLEARKAIEIPDVVRTRLMPIVIEQLNV